MPSLRSSVVVLASLALAACQTFGAGGTRVETPVPAAAAPAAPLARGPFVAAANPLAVEAGLKVLREGGSAVDAAVAMQAVLGLVEPQSSGLGGGAFMMAIDAATGEVTSYDGRETAPAAATPELFYENGKPLGVGDAMLSGRSTGAPGRRGHAGDGAQGARTAAVDALFGDAERLARDGFAVSPRLAGFIAATRGQARSRWADAYFTKADGTRYVAGDVLKNPAYADTVASWRPRGARGLLQRPHRARDRRCRGAGAAARRLTAADIAAYQPIERGALCRPYRIYVVCVPPPPSSGVAVLQLLAMAEQTPDIHGGPDSAEAWTAFAQLQRLMYADRDRYVGDPGFVRVPVQGLLDPEYVAARAVLAPGLTGAAEPGSPPGGVFAGPDATREPAGTSHHRHGRRPGQCGQHDHHRRERVRLGPDGGGLLHEQPADRLLLRPDAARRREAANAVAAGKRPRSSMSPVIVLDRQGRLVGAFGSPGGPSILAYNTKALIAVLDWGMPVQAAFALPNLVAKGDGFGADTDRFSEALRAGLARAGHPSARTPARTRACMARSGVAGPTGWGWDGGADDRREGQARTH
jgi:gamma-glutamyltranspeptidase/glutathione hydrolase